jgi:hypothetical protein
MGLELETPLNARRVLMLPAVDLGFGGGFWMFYSSQDHTVVLYLSGDFAELSAAPEDVKFDTSSQTLAALVRKGEEVIQVTRTATTVASSCNT